MEKLWESILGIGDKHLIPSIFSFAIGIIIFAYTSEDFWIVEKITKTGYSFLLFSIVFLLVQIVIYLFKTISQYIINLLEKGKSKISEEHETMESLWSFIDGLSVSDRELIREFLENGNKPISNLEGPYNYSSSLYWNNRYMNFTTVKGQDGF